MSSVPPNAPINSARTSDTIRRHRSEPALFLDTNSLLPSTKLRLFCASLGMLTFALLVVINTASINTTKVPIVSLYTADDNIKCIFDIVRSRYRTSQVTVLED